MINQIKKTTNSLLSKFGYKISKLGNGFSFNQNLEWLKEKNIGTILDIGANDGQFAKFINSVLPEARIYSFEPIKSCYEKLNILASKIPKLMPINIGLGDKSEFIELNVNEFTPSSSILSMEKRHIENFPFTSKSVKEKIEVKDLDSIYHNLQIEQNVLVKIDVQGYEGRVLKGSWRFLSEIPGIIIIIECSIIPLYKDEPSVEEIYDMLRSLKYSYKGNLNQLYSPVNGEILQADLIFQK